MSWSIKQLLFTIGSVFLLASCQKDTDIGLDLQPQSNQIGVFFQDTFSLKTSTVLLDSVVSASQNSYPSVLLAGKYSDPLFGNITAQSFLTVHQFENFNAQANPTCDSIVLNLVYDYYYGNLSQPQTITVYRLTDTLNVNATYYNSPSFSPAPGYEATPLGSKTFVTNPQKNDTIRIKFDASLNATLGNQILSNSFVSNDFTQFYKLFKGLALIPANTNTAVLGFNTFNTNSAAARVSSLRVYYRNTTVPGQQFIQNFYLGGGLSVSRGSQSSLVGGSSFNQVTADRSGTVLAGLMRTNAIPSSQTNGQAYIQSALGIATKIEFPYLRAFAQAGRIGINQAELVIGANSTGLGNNLLLPPSVLLAETNATNQIATNTSGTRIYVQQELGGAGVTDNFNVYSTGFPQVQPLSSGTYNFLITSYFQAMVSGVGATEFNTANGRKPNNGLLVVPASNSSIYGGSIPAGSNIKLRVRYSLLK